MPQITARLFTGIPVSSTQSDEMTGLSGRTEKTIQVFGTFAATVQAQGTIDGSTWVDVGSSVTAPGLINISEHVTALRLDITYTSGTIQARLIALDQNTA